MINPLLNNQTKNMIKNKKTLVSVTLLTLFLFIPVITHAETHIKSEDVRENLVFTKEGSPYYIEDYIYIPRGSTLDIMPGVEVIGVNNSQGGEAYALGGEGVISVKGTKQEPVKISNLASFYVDNSTMSIENGIFDNSPIYINNSTTTIKDSVLQNAFEAVSAENADLEVTGTTLKNNSYGIFSKKHNTIFQASNDSIESKGFGIGGEGDISQIPLDPEQNIITIKNSSILNNSNYGIINQTKNPIDARENWWGVNTWPSGAMVYGLINVEPWLSSDPALPVAACCSNVLFIPGMEASRLYIDEDGLFGTSTNRLWEPNTENDVKVLRMDQDGKSINQGIYSKDVMNVAYKIPGVYSGAKVYLSFSDSMDELVSEGKINKWLPFAYDWRKSPLEIVDDKFINSVVHLASESKTKKVTVIAHSNGGLVTKVLSNKLKEIGKENLIDQIIFVAVPELGTPQAVAAILHGYGQSLAKIALPTESNARIFSQNLPGPYNLLPSRDYFQNIGTEVISNNFSDTNKKIDSYEKFKEFVLSNGYSKFEAFDLDIPLKLNQKIFELADSFHSVFDKWLPSTNTKISSIYGWGLITPNNVAYKAKAPCYPEILVCKPEFHLNGNERGDGTVITDAGTTNMDTKLFLNLKDLNIDEDTNISHAFILESKALINKIKDMITDQSALGKDYNKYFTKAEPISSTKYLSVTIHSPVDIDVYDRKGRHTGSIPSTDPRSKYFAYEDEIPLSAYRKFGETKNVILPFTEQYKIDLNGTGLGLFSVDVEVIQNGKNISTTSFSVLPVTPFMVMELVVGTSTVDLASTTVMNIDTDGDGQADIVNRTVQALGLDEKDPISDIQTYLEMSKQVIISLNLSMQKELFWLNRIDKISKKLEKNHPKKAEKIVKKILTKKLKSKNIDESQKVELLKLFEQILTYFESKD